MRQRGEVRKLIGGLMGAGAIAAAGCGGGGDDALPADRDAIVETLTDSALRPGAEQCTAAATARFVRVTYGSLAACEEQTELETPARSVDISAVRVSGARASARIAFTGGELPGEDLDVLLRREDGRWKVDKLGLPTTIRRQFAEDFDAELRRQGLPAAERRCNLRLLRKAIRRIEVVEDGLDTRAFERRAETVAGRCLPG